MKNLIQAAAFPLIASSALHAQSPAVQWRVEDGGNGHWYERVFAGPGVPHWTFDAASARAFGKGAQLASFETLQEGMAAYGLLGIAELPPRDAGWIGLFQDRSDPSYVEPSGGWKWVSGAALEYGFWAEGRPDNAGCENPNNAQDWGKWTGGQALGDVYARWDDEGNPAPTCPFGTVHAIVEWSADCNGDGVVDYGQCRDGSLPDYNGNNIPDCCESGILCSVGNYPVQWRVESGGNGHWYQRDTETGRWAQARVISESVGGHLVTLTTAAEQSFVWSALRLYGAGWFLGAVQQPDSCEPGCGWTWITGEPWNYTNWASFAPDNNTVLGNEDRLCTNIAGSWDDFADCVACVDRFVIEWSADCNNDGIVDYGQILQGALADANNDGVPDICQQPTCRDADLYTNGRVDGADLAALLSEWGPVTSTTRSDFDDNGQVNGADLAFLLSVWGLCP